MSIKLPDIAQGKVVPHSFEIKMLKEEEEKKKHKTQLRQNIIINVGCVVLGAVLSNLSDIVKWITGLFS